MAPPSRPEKTMSSRLLTMKFMQRAASTGFGSSPSKPSPSTPDEGRPSKRARLSDSPTSSTNYASPEDIRAAVAAEDLKRTQALDRSVQNGAETRWEFNIAEPGTRPTEESALQTVSAGYAMIDAEEAGEAMGNGSGSAMSTGRRLFGRMREMKRESEEPDMQDSSHDSTHSESEDDYEDSKFISPESKPHPSALRQERDRKRYERSKPSAAAKARNKKELNLNRVTSGRVTSISSGKGGRNGGGGTSDGIKCHKCGQMGHKQWQCPKSGRSFNL